MVDEKVRDRHCTVAQLRVALASLRPDDIVCTALATGNLAIIRGEHQIGYIDLAPQDLSEPAEPSATLELEALRRRAKELDTRT